MTLITLAIILKELDNFTNSFLETPTQLTLAIPQMLQLPPTFYIKIALSKNVLGVQQWKDPLQERQFSISFEPGT